MTSASRSLSSSSFSGSSQAIDPVLMNIEDEDEDELLEGSPADIAGNKKRKRRPNAAVVADDENLRRLDRITRWSVFLNHSNKKRTELLEEIYGTDYDIDSWEWGYGLRIVDDHAAQYKQTMLKNLETQIEDMEDSDEDDILLSIEDRAVLAQYFKAKFNTVNFLSVWSYMAKYIDFEKSSALGKWYIENIYVNLAVEVKIYLNEKRKGLGAVQRPKLRTFYDQLPKQSQILAAGVTKSDFKESRERIRNEKRKPKQLDPNEAHPHKRVVLTSPPPPKG